MNTEFILGLFLGFLGGVCLSVIIIYLYVRDEIRKQVARVEGDE